MKIRQLKKISLIILLSIIHCFGGKIYAAQVNDSKINAWVAEAILNTYTFDAENLIARQKIIAKYFTANGWIDYSKALRDSKLIAVVQKNKYSVAAIPLKAPLVETTEDHKFTASMPIIVTYHGKSSEQTQALDVKIIFSITSQDSGVDGKAIERLWASPLSQPCSCNRTEPCKK
jgi:hypothetical protein